MAYDKTKLEDAEKKKKKKKATGKFGEGLGSAITAFSRRMGKSVDRDIDFGSDFRKR